MSKYSSLVDSKPTLLTLVVIGVVAALSIPVLIPHFSHGTHIFHLLLHTGGIILAVFLTILGINAYSKIKTKKLAITSVAFFVFVAHMLMICMIGIFAYGIFRGD